MLCMHMLVSHQLTHWHFITLYNYIYRDTVLLPIKVHALFISSIMTSHRPSFHCSCGFYCILIDNDVFIADDEDNIIKLKTEKSHDSILPGDTQSSETEVYIHRQLAYSHD